MLKRLNIMLNIFIVGLLVIYMCYGTAIYLHYLTHPGLYIMQSAPWYTGMIVYGLITVIILLIAIVAKLVIRKKIK